MEAFEGIMVRAIIKLQVKPSGRTAVLAVHQLGLDDCKLTAAEAVLLLHVRAETLEAGFIKQPAA